MDYEGAASPKSIEKINYYRKLNVRAMEKRMKLLSQGPETPKEQKIQVGPGIDGGIRLVSFMDVLGGIGVTELLEFSH